MDEYIKREAALALVKPDAPEDEKAAVTIATAKKLVRSIVCRTPAADVVPVVRCKDCKYWQGNNDDYPHEECDGGTKKHRMPMTFAAMESGGKNEKLE